MKNYYPVFPVAVPSLPFLSGRLYIALVNGKKVKTTNDLYIKINTGAALALGFPLAAFDLPFPLPPSAASVFAGFSAFAFSGSRADASAVAAAASVFPLVPSGALVVVGCASGVDAAARAAFPSAVVFRVSAFAFGGRVVRASFARRSVAVVGRCAQLGGLFCSFPLGACPVGLVPCASPFAGFGSGSWSSLACAVFQGCACFVSVSPLCAPSWLVSRGVFLGGSSWFVPPVLSLFG